MDDIKINSLECLEKIEDLNISLFALDVSILEAGNSPELEDKFQFILNQLELLLKMYK